MAVPLNPDFDEEVDLDADDEMRMYAKMMEETSRQFRERTTKKSTPVVIEIEKGSDSMVVEVENPFEDIDVKVVAKGPATSGMSGTAVSRSTKRYVVEMAAVAVTN